MQQRVFLAATNCHRRKLAQMHYIEKCSRSINVFVLYYTGNFTFFCFVEWISFGTALPGNVAVFNSGEPSG